MAAAFPSQNSTFVPSFEASGSLQIEFSRNPKRFKINQYCKIVPVKKGAGYYLKITAEEAARIINTDLADFYWMDGQEAPMGNDNLESFEYVKFLTKRLVFPYNLGQKAVEQADWNILATHSRIASQKAMTARTQSAWTKLSDTANWTGSNATASSLGGGKWDVSGASDKYILKTFNAVAEEILKSTLGVVQREDLVCVVNPNVARQMMETEEIRDVLKQSPFALGYLKMDKEAISSSTTWGLPPELYGIRLIVEDAVKVTSKKLATRAASYVCPAATAVFMARPGGLMGAEGVPEFSTSQFFMYEEFTVESKDDPDNRRTTARVVEDYDFQVVAAASGYLVTATVD